MPKSSRKKPVRRLPKTSGLSPRDAVIAQDLAEGMRQIDVAKKHGLTDRAIRRKLEDLRFREHVASLQRAMFKATVRMVLAGGREAAMKLRQLLRSGNEATALKAADALLERIVPLASLDGLRDQADEVKSGLDDWNGGMYEPF